MRLLKLTARFFGSRPPRRLRAFVIVVGLFANAPALEADTVTATWDANPEANIGGYVLKYGILPGVYSTSLDVGNVTSRQVTLGPGQRYYFAVQAYNTSLLYSPLSVEVFIDIPAVNLPPVLTNPGNRTNAENATISLQLSATDPNGDVLSYSATNLPGGLSINSTTGLISGTLTYTSAGTHSVTATASDGSLSNSKTFTWTVTNTNRAPVLTSPGNRTNAENATISLQLSASDPDGDVLSYSATNLPGGLSINSTTGLISGTLSYTSAGTHSVTATASDGSLSNSKTFTWTVTATNRAPALTNPGNRTNAENAAISLQLSASDADGDVLSYSATNLPGGLSINSATGLISGTLSSTSAGTYSVTATASDGSLSNSKTFTWTVTDANQAPVLGTLTNRTDVEGDAVFVQLPATDPNGDPLTFSATGLPAGVVLDTFSGLVSGTIAAGSAGNHTVAVTVSDGSLSANGSFIWSVINTPPDAATPLTPNGLVNTNTPTFTWPAVGGSSWYWVSITDSTGATTQQWYTRAEAGCGTGTCAITPSGLFAAGPGSWSLMTWNSKGYGPRSVNQGFVMNLQSLPLALPVAARPLGTIISRMPDFAWSAVPGATWYWLQVTDAADVPFEQWFTSATLGCAAGTGTCTANPGFILAEGAAEWKVQPWSPAGHGLWTSDIPFTIVAAPPGPAVPLGPFGTINNARPTYSWNAAVGSSYYYLRLNDSTGTPLEIWYSAAAAGCGSGTGMCAVTPAYDIAPGSASWSVLTWNSSGYGPWSAAAEFRLAASPPPAATPVSPIGGVTVTGAITLTWAAVPDATYYLVRMSDSLGATIEAWYTPAQAGCLMGTGTCSVNPAVAPGSGWVDWVVMTWNPFGYGPWSLAASFQKP